MAIKDKFLSVKPWGSKRVVKLIRRFGWELYDATENTEITETTEYHTEIEDGEIKETKTTSRSKYTTYDLHFVRDSSAFFNLPAIFLPELLFNVVFFFRRITGTLAPLAIAAFAIMVFLAGGDADIIANDSISRVCVAEIVVWIALRICEQILSITAKLILKRKKRY